MLYKLTHRRTHMHAPRPTVPLDISTFFPTEPAGGNFPAIYFQKQMMAGTGLFLHPIPVRRTPLPPPREWWNWRFCLSLGDGEPRGSLRRGDTRGPEEPHRRCRPRLPNLPLPPAARRKPPRKGKQRRYVAAAWQLPRRCRCCPQASVACPRRPHCSRAAAAGRR